MERVNAYKCFRPRFCDPYRPRAERTADHHVAACPFRRMIRGKKGRPQMEQEDVSLCPLAGWSLATLPEGHVMVSVDYVTSLAELMSGARRSLRLSMTVAQAAELGQAILKTAAAPHIPEPPTPSRN
jgi:hypothetical protein